MPEEVVPIFSATSLRGEQKLLTTLSPEGLLCSCTLSSREEEQLASLRLRLLNCSNKRSLSAPLQMMEQVAELYRVGEVLMRPGL